MSKDQKWYPARVAGVTYDNPDGSSRQKYIKKCRVGQPVDLIPERDNPHDPHAVKVCRPDGAQIGYVQRDQAENVSRAFDDGNVPMARVLETGKKQGTRYCVIEICYSG